MWVYALRIKQKEVRQLAYTVKIRWERAKVSIYSMIVELNFMLNMHQIFQMQKNTVRSSGYLSSCFEPVVPGGEWSIHHRIQTLHSRAVCCVLTCPFPAQREGEQNKYAIGRGRSADLQQDQSRKTNRLFLLNLNRTSISPFTLDCPCDIMRNCSLRCRAVL